MTAAISFKVWMVLLSLVLGNLKGNNISINQGFSKNISPCYKARVFQVNEIKAVKTYDIQIRAMECNNEPSLHDSDWMGNQTLIANNIFLQFRNSADVKCSLLQIENIEMLPYVTFNATFEVSNNLEKPMGVKINDSWWLNKELTIYIND